MSSPLKKPDFSREHRLGLVVYGGVALAIYMNGICQEFYNAVRGRGIYKLIKALTDADIVVDIISGTSAGGINGVLLSYALANSKKKKQIKFEEFAKVWKDNGDIQALLFKKEYDGVEKSSFFDGVGYYKSEIRKALEDRRQDLDKNASQNDWFSEFGELDLFVTGTELLGRTYQVFDNTGCVIDVKDHHAIFHLKYREHGDNDFKPEDKNDTTCEALAKLCQITSCFPVAFPPVTVKLDPKDGDADKKLVEWGSLKKNRILPEESKIKKDESRSSDPRLEKIDDDPGEGYRLHFVDGGVLDNRPFTYTIKAIYHRTAERPVFRKLFYVDPNPDRFSNKFEKMLKPDIVEVVKDSLIGMPRYESINNDLELIKEHNEKVLRYKFLLVDLEALLDKEIPDIQNKDFYDQQKNVYLRTRLISLEDKLLPLIFLESDNFEQASSKEKNRIKKLDKVAELLAKPLTDPKGSSNRLDFLQKLEEGICDLDVDYTLRKYFFITEYLYRLLDKEYLSEWIKNKKKEEIDKRYNISEEIKHKTMEEINELFIKNEHIKDKVKEEIEKISIDEEIVGNLKYILKNLNQNIKFIETIKDNLVRLFVYKGIEDYFYGLLDEVPDEKFPEKFYRAMLWLHGQFLNVELPSNLDANLDVKQLSHDLDKNFHKFKNPKAELDRFFNDPSEEQLDKLKKLAEKSILKKLLSKTESELSNNIIGINEHYNYIKKKLLKYFRDFEKLDTVLYPLDYLAGIPEKQIIETFRISPEDAALGLSSTTNIKKGERLDKKLAGDTLKAFGGFLKKSWRANDILWGRLDGFNRIVDALVTEDKIKNFPKVLQGGAKREKIELDKYLDYLLEEALLPNFDQKRKYERNLNSEEDEQYLREKINELKEKLYKIFPSLEPQNSDKQALKDEQISKEHLQDFVKSLVSVGHLIILEQEFKDTMQVSIEEQLTWKQQKRPNKKAEAPKKDTIQVSLEEPLTCQQQQQLDKKPEIPKFDPITCSFNSAITALVVKELAERSLTSMSLKQKEGFFNEHYKIGSETLDDIPKSELEKIAVRFVRIFQDILKTWQLRPRRNNSHSKRKRPTLWNQLGFGVVNFMVILGVRFLRMQYRKRN